MAADNGYPLNKPVEWDGDETCLVTGGAGFIGSYLVRELVRQGKRVVVYDGTPDAGYIADCVDVDRASVGNVTFVYGDVADMPHLLSVMTEYGVQVVFHLAYLLEPDSENNLGTAIRVNCAGFHNVLEAARVLNVRRVVWPSSAAVYGPAEYYPPGPVGEDVFVKPTLVYAACKLFNEHISRFYWDKRGLDVICFRGAVVYGLGKSRRRDYSIAHLLVENALLGRPVVLPPMDYSANWVYVKDIVRAYLSAARAPRPKHMLFNMCGFPYRCSEVVEILKGILPQVTVHPTKQYLLAHPVEVSMQDQSRAKEELGYEPAYPLEEGVKDYLQMLEQFSGQYKSAWSAYDVVPLP